MTYLFYGSEDYFIKKEIEQLRKKVNISEIEVNKIDFNNTTIKDIIIDANTLSLFEDKKMIIIDNAWFFTNNTKKVSNDVDLTDLFEYLENMNPNCELIFINEKVNNVKKVTKALKKFGVVKEFNNSNNSHAIVKEILNGYKISNETINLIVKRAGNNTNLLVMECEKLKYYKLEEKEINNGDVNKLVVKNIDLDIFKLIDSIIYKDTSTAIEVLHEMLKHGEEPIKLIVMLANQFRLMYQAKSLILKGYSEDLIAKKLNQHPYSVKLALSKSRNYSEDKLINLISDLSDIDLNIKTGKIDKVLALDLFILNL